MNNIKKLRNAKGWSQKRLSEESGLATRTIEKWESGERIPRDVYKIHRVATALGVKIEDIINFERM